MTPEKTLTVRTGKEGKIRRGFRWKHAYSMNHVASPGETGSGKKARPNSWIDPAHQRKGETDRTEAS